MRVDYLSSSAMKTDLAGNSRRKILREGLSPGAACRSVEFVLHRILGNDLPPRHEVGQTYRNCRFILDHEPWFENCEKRWIVNRIINEEEERQIVALLEQYDQPHTLIPFRLEEYARVARTPRPPPDEWKRHYIYDDAQALRHSKILYAMNNNAARNAALDEGRNRGSWALPFDGNCVFDQSGWDLMVERLATGPYPVYAVPMYRLLSNNEYFDFSLDQAHPHEPQLVFCNCVEHRFDERYRWGLNPKIQMIERLGLPFEIEKEALHVRDDWTAGYVLRLYSGVQEAEGSTHLRIYLRNKAINRLLCYLDAEVERLGL